MKWVLLVSLILNGVLGWKLLTQKEIVREEIVEKVVVKQAEPEIIEKKVIVEVPKEKPAEEAVVPGPVEFDERDMTDVVEEVTQARNDFLQNQLQLTDKDMKSIESVKQRYIQKYMEVIPPNHRGSITLEQRKKMLELEEERDGEYARVFGQKKWDAFNRFREEYNQKMYKQGMKTKGIIVPMEI
jgi:hypothetical protein